MGTTTQTTRENEMTTETTHLHDLGITISAGDLTPEQMEAVRLVLRVQVQALVERINNEIGETKVGWSTTYDGSRECGEH
jgi:hypothetical protein